jgi:hypothetical protein
MWMLILMVMVMVMVMLFHMLMPILGSMFLALRIFQLIIAVRIEVLLDLVGRIRMSFFQVLYL